MNQRLSFGEKLSYGAGDLGPAIAANLIVVFQLIFFTNVAGLNPGIAGTVLLIGKAWDAVNDPMIGLLSDRTQNPWGRRLPWLFWGAIPFGLSFFFLWLVPQFSPDPAQNQTLLFWYYVLVAIAVNTFYTVVNLPYTALTAELTQDYDERTSLNSFRFGFSISGSILSLILALVIFQLIPNDPLRQYLVLGGVGAVIITLPLYWCVGGIRRRAIQMEQTRRETTNSAMIPIGEQLQIAFRNRPFLFVIGIYLCSWLAVQNTVAIIPYFVKNWMGLSDQAFTQVVLAVQVTALVMLFVWARLSAALGKKMVYFLGMLAWIGAQTGLFFLQPGQTTLLFGLAVVAGVGVATAYLIPWSMIPDVIELDELETGQRREGIFYALMVFLQKIGLAIGLFLVGQALEVSGFIKTVAGQPEPIQPAAALWAIRVMIGPLPTLVLILGLVFAYFYPITREKHAEILLQLAERKGAADPPEIQ
ncbi:Na+/melibiose symporter and related transporters [Gloeomargarita lithophora Alchichica-D10]|uniref:Na+/melibiose symporter and related transporters n=1 Tax=Gloeomargarita lithophora Alchichica-D10 TaxID=1188229 RepID=A0A1J0AE97_9CYAN|nr:MFS transporter [Gloeomargarita lithophora]APB34270.1 Na+/melibiose symporter and related transporters [Gloeomargarita lithophora Alchichica-D10]